MKRSARASFVAVVAAGAVLAAFAPFQSAVVAFPMATPAPRSSPSSSPSPGGNTLPFASTLTFVLDGTISSRSSKADDVVNAHLQNALVVGDHEVAPAGTRVQIRILDAKPADNPDIYGFVDIYFRPLALPDGREVPLRAPSARLNVNTTAGHESTVAIENTVGDIFTPTALLHVFRKGRNFTLEPGASIRALTEATMELLPSGVIAITTPAPLVIEGETPHATFNAAPLATPQGKSMPLQAPVLTPDPQRVPPGRGVPMPTTTP